VTDINIQNEHSYLTASFKKNEEVLDEEGKREQEV
jgi:hypothetical protein